MLDNESVCSAWNLRRGSREVKSFLNVDQDCEGMHAQERPTMVQENVNPMAQNYELKYE